MPLVRFTCSVDSHALAFVPMHHANDQVRQHKADSATQRKLWHLA